LTLGIHLSVANSASAKSPIDFSDQGPGFSTPPISCKDYKDDRAYLLDVNVNISPGSTGPTVRVTRASDGKVLREIYQDEKFYDGGGNLIIQYTITPQCGGFDVVYTLSNPMPLINSLPLPNPSDAPQPQPELRVEGFHMATSGDVYMLRTKDYGNVQKLKLTNDQGIPNTDFEIGSYPGMVYSPVIVAHDSVFAAGSALHYPQLSPGYRNTVISRLERVITGPQTGTWKHRYHGFTEDVGICERAQTPTNTTIPPGEQRVYTISVRFSEPRYWLLTLFPYKQYFDSLYSASADIRPKDLRPVKGILAALREANTPGPGNPNPWETNPRSYLPFIGPDGKEHRVDTGGWGPFADYSIWTMKTYGYERIMIWAPSGLFGPDMPALDFNYPPQFMSDWLPIPFKTQGELSHFADNKLSLGMWWGRSTQIPEPPQWNPWNLHDAEYTNLQHKALLTHELKLAHERGTKEIGLDAFVCMPTHERYLWVDDMKNLAPGAFFIHEGAGPDSTHSKMGNYYVPPDWNGQQVEAPDVLSAYLNPGSEIWIVLNMCDGLPWCSFAGMQNLVRWGFTPVSHWPLIDVKGLDYTLVACFDGLDNDGDGLTDWPYDPDCATAAGLSEHGPQPVSPAPLAWPARSGS
jgi:hypothetical protein